MISADMFIFVCAERILPAQSAAPARTDSVDISPHTLFGWAVLAPTWCARGGLIISGRQREEAINKEKISAEDV